MPGYLVQNTPSARGSRPVYKHVPVLVQEVITFLRPDAGGIYVDATVGEGGHAEAILHASAPDGRNRRHIDPGETGCGPTGTTVCVLP